MAKTFVTRPRESRRRGELMEALLATAENGKAITMSSVGGPYHYRVQQHGLKMHTKRQKDGTYLAWCSKS